MFQTLRANSQIYILHKDATPYIETGTVVSVSAPSPKFPMPTHQPFGAPTEMVVDVVARVNGQNVTFQKLPANKEVEDSAVNGLVISTSRDAMNSEISVFKQRSIDIVNSVEYHKNLIIGYDKILEVLNPEYAEKQRQAEEITMLKAQLGDMSSKFDKLMALLQDEKHSPKSSKKE